MVISMHSYVNQSDYSLQMGVSLRCCARRDESRPLADAGALGLYAHEVCSVYTCEGGKHQLELFAVQPHAIERC